MSTFRYQLLYAVAGTIIEAKNQSAAVAVFIIHEFVSAYGKSKKALQNKDLNDFILMFTEREQSITVGKLIGPVHVPGGGRVSSEFPLYFGKIESQILKV